MKKDFLEGLVNELMYVSEIADSQSLAETTVKYWLKKHALADLYVSLSEPRYAKRHGRPRPVLDSKVRECSCCRLVKTLDCFYKSEKRVNRYCKKCMISTMKDVAAKYKAQCVEYKGGSCSVCGYNRCLSALEFHHVDPSKKDFSPSRANRTFNRKVRDELDKCILVCANCHREIHSRM